MRPTDRERSSQPPEPSFSLPSRRRRSSPVVGVGVALAVLVVVGTAVVVGWSGGDAAPAGPTVAIRVPPEGASAPSTVPPTTVPPRRPRGSGAAVTFAFAGDTHFESYLRTALDADPEHLLDPIAPVLSAADVAVVNLETSITERGTPAPKQYTFRAPSTALVALRSAGVDVASLANNHGLDYGPESLEDALAASRALPLIGIGRDAARAYRPFRVDVRGQRIAILAATQVLDGNLVAAWTATDDRPGLASAKEEARLVAAVRAARRDADTVVVFLHWGTELQTCPQERQRSLARALADAGADIVVGGHAHRLQGAGFLGDTFVGYGLGNFVWYAKPGPSSQSGVLTVTATGREVDGYAWHPATIRGGIPRPLDGAEATAAVAAWDALRACTDLTAAAGAGYERGLTSRARRGHDEAMAIEYDELGLFHENAREHGLAWSGPPVVARRTVDVRGGQRVSALCWGGGDPELVLLHGGAQNAHTWDTVALALDRPLVAFDLPGHGHSDHRPDHRYWPDENARAIATAMRALAPAPRLVVGMSLGGLSAIALAARDPDLVPALVLVDVTPGVDRGKAAAIVEFVSGPEVFASFEEILERTIAFNPTRSESSLRRGVLHNACEQDDGTWTWRYDLPRGARRRRGRHGDAVLPGLDRLWDQLGAYRGPLTLVRGATSPVVSDADVAEVRRRRPDAVVEIVADAGHSIQGDRPVELARLLAGRLDP